MIEPVETLDTEILSSVSPNGLEVYVSDWRSNQGVAGWPQIDRFAPGTLFGHSPCEPYIEITLSSRPVGTEVEFQLIG